MGVIFDKSSGGYKCAAHYAAEPKSTRRELISAALFVLVTIFIIDPFNPYTLRKTTSGVETQVHPFMPGYLIKLPQAYEVFACSSGNVPNCRKVVLLSGSVNASMKESFDLLMERSSIKNVCLSSPGGHIKAAYMIGSTISKLSLNTCMADSYYREWTDFSGKKQWKKIDLRYSGCASACPFILMSGKSRQHIGIRQPTIKLHKEGYYDHRLLGLIIHKRDFINDNYADSYLYKLIKDTSKFASDYKNMLALLKKSRETKFSDPELYQLRDSDINKFNIFNADK